MIKKSLVLILITFSLFAFLGSPSKTLAKGPTPTPAEMTKMEATQEAYIKYNLAYPGILPGHPLFKLKVLRDKITAALITDPRKKIDFYLLQTDKGILAAAMLVDQKKYDLAKQTVLKAEHNYTLLTQELYNLPKKPDNDFFSKLRTASLKHQEVISSIIKRVPKEDKKTFETVVDFSKRNWKTVEDNQKKKRVL